MARASSVLPAPGGPTNRTPRGIRPPNFWNRCGSRKNSTISLRSSLASSTPATSSKVTRPCVSVSSLALDLPKPMAFPPALHLPGKNDPYAQKHNNRQRVDEDGHQPIRAFRRRLGRNRDFLLVKRLDQRRIIRRVACEGPVIRKVAGYLIAGNRHFTDM